MSMELKNNELLEAVGALRDLAGEKLPVRTSLKLLRLIRSVEAAVEIVDKVRQQIVQRHVRRDEAGNPMPMLGEDGAPQEGMVMLSDPGAFHREMEELLQAATPVEASPLDPEELGEEMRVSPQALLRLGPLLRMESA